MKKFITILILCTAFIGCSKQDNDAIQHISRTAEALLFNKEAGGETIILENATAVIDVFADNRMIVHIKIKVAKKSIISHLTM